MDSIEYLETRVENQINWYSKKSSTNKKLFYWFKGIEIVLVTCIPILISYYHEQSVLKACITVASIIVAISGSLPTLLKFHENWLGYRTTAEMLKHEKNLFLTKAAPYNETDEFNLFVQRIEHLISQENSNWIAYVQSGRKKENGKA